jgi:glycosyltransferase involved in cell wall biosynthesis
MRLLAIVPNLYDTSPGQRFRIEQWEPLLREQGVEITYAPFLDAELSSILYRQGQVGKKLSHVVRRFHGRLSDVRSAKDFDVVYIFREAALFGPPIFERMIGRQVPFVFDFDDAIFVSYRSPSNGYLSYLKFAAKASTICRLASHVMVGNPYLAEYSRQFNPNVTVIPTTIDLDKYHVVKHAADSEPVVIGWTGSFSTVQHLDTLRSALQKLARREKFRLKVIGTPEYNLKGVDVEAMDWRADTEVEDLTPCDIGIMPLPDDAWSKGKCGLKALQFMALGTPVICSPVGVNTDIIQDAENGYLADSEDEWVEKLGTLIRSAESRKRIGLAGRATVEARYSATVQAPRVFEIFQSLIAQKPQLAASQLRESTTAMRQHG